MDKKHISYLLMLLIEVEVIGDKTVKSIMQMILIQLGHGYILHIHLL